MGIEFGLVNWLILAAFLLATTWFGHQMSNKAGQLRLLLNLECKNRMGWLGFEV